MATATEIQALLRFLTQDAKVPLATALPKVGDLRKADLNNAEKISKASLSDLTPIFTNDKLAKQIINAAKRITNSKKRPISDKGANSPALKRAKRVDKEKPGRSEDVLELPSVNLGEKDLVKFTLQTNRAPLVLAFAVTLLKYTMPEQPLSSRLSLAQAVVSANSQSKAKAIGLTNERTAEDEGWGKGQPKVRIMGREIPVMRRVVHPDSDAEDDGQARVKEDDEGKHSSESLLGLDLEALRKSNGPLLAGKHAGDQAGLPIYSPQAARNYLLKSFTIFDGPRDVIMESTQRHVALSTMKSTPAGSMAEKEQAAAVLIVALDLLFTSWLTTLTREELDRRAWSWYLHVRPEVAQGQAGWGQKGEVHLEEILKLRRVS